MLKTIRKWFWIWDFEKEEQWLNEMAAKGLVLADVGWCSYKFEECIPGEYIIRLEFYKHIPNFEKQQEYISFLKETGVEHIGNISRWGYFRKKTNLGGFDLFSDIDSRISHLNRILLFIGILSFPNIFNSLNYLIRFAALYEARPAILGIYAILCPILIYAFINVYIKRAKLKKERALHE